MNHENIMPFEVIDDKYGVVFSESTADLFEDTVSNEPEIIKKGYRGCVNWGSDNLFPVEVLDKVRKNEVMNSNMLFNIQTGYGDGFVAKRKDGAELDDDVEEWLEDNNLQLYFLEQWTDLKHFFFAVAEIILNGEGTKIVELNHLESFYVRFETSNSETGKIEHIFYANWEDNPADKEIEAIPLLDTRNPYKDLAQRVEKGKSKKEKKFAILMKIPIPGRKYYPDPYYYSAFKSGWYDVSAMTATAKKMAMQYGIKVRFMVRIHPEYWNKIYKEENISDKDEQLARKKQEYLNIKNFLTSYENEGKTWFNGFYINPDGKEVPYVQIEKIDYDKGGEFNQDAEEASNMICYAQGVHPNLIGATPGKSKGSFSGTDKRELFTMKQSLERPFKDLLLTPMKVIKRFNEWDRNIKFDLPMILMTTLDKGTDAQKVEQENTQLKSQIDATENN